MAADGLMLPDARLAIQTHDEAIVLVQYSGGCVSSGVMNRWPSSPLRSKPKTPVTNGSTASRRPVKTSSRPNLRTVEYALFELT